MFGDHLTNDGTALKVKLTLRVESISYKTLKLVRTLCELVKRLFSKVQGVFFLFLYKRKSVKTNLINDCRESGGGLEIRSLVLD